MRRAKRRPVRLQCAFKIGGYCYWGWFGAGC